MHPMANSNNEIHPDWVQSDETLDTSSYLETTEIKQKFIFS